MGISYAGHKTERSVTLDVVQSMWKTKDAHSLLPSWLNKFHFNTTSPDKRTGRNGQQDHTKGNPKKDIVGKRRLGRRITWNLVVIPYNASIINSRNSVRPSYGTDAILPIEILQPTWRI